MSGVVAALDNKNKIRCKVYNLGNSSPIYLNGFISTCKKVVGKKAKRDLGYEPKVELENGLRLMYNSLC